MCAINVITYHVEEFWSLDRDEIDTGLSGDGLGKQGLSATGRAHHKNTRRLSEVEYLTLTSILYRSLSEFVNNILY
jgi:hypothetical protein